MKLDYKKFKKVAVDEHTTTLEHESGHQIKVAHKKLSKENQDELHAVPMFATGGEVDTPKKDYTEVPGVGDWLAQGMQSMYTPDEGADSRFTPKSLSDTSMIGGFASKEAPPLASKAPEAPAAPDTTDYGSPKLPGANPTTGITAPMGGDMYSQGLAHMKQGLTAGAEAQQLQAGQELEAAKDYQAKQAEMQQHYQNSYNELNQSRMDLMQDIKDGHINPNHYMDSQSNLGKISTAIGLIMGGIGGGATGQGNPALDFINKQIDRDIESQKATLNSKHTLLSATMQQFGNIRDAEQMARVYQTDIYKAKLEQALATAKSPMAKANLQKAIGELEMTAAPHLQEMAQKKAILSGLQSGAAAPEAAVQFLVPKEHQKEVFAEIGRVQAAREHGDEIRSWFKKAAKDNEILKTGAGLRTPASVTNLMNLMMPILKDNEGRVNETEIHMMKDFVPALGDSEGKIAEKEKGLMQFIESKTAAPTAKGYGIDLQKLYPSKASEVGLSKSTSFPRRK